MTSKPYQSQLKTGGHIELVGWNLIRGMFWPYISHVTH